MKSEVVSLLLFQDSFKTSWVGVMQTITKDEFAIAFWQMYEYFYKCIQIGDDYIEKSWEINTFLTLTIVFLLKYSSLIMIPPRSYDGRYAIWFIWILFSKGV